MIAEVMRNYFKALTKGDFDLLLSVFWDNAQIDSKALNAQGVVSRDEYGRAIAPELPFFNSVRFFDLLIRVHDERTASVYGFTHYIFRWRPGKTRGRIWKFMKENGIWKIYESSYLPV